jgi:predicted amino acid dehydrogenase
MTGTPPSPTAETAGTFGFVVHPLTPFQRRLIGVRSGDGPLMRGQESLRPPGRVISALRLDRPDGGSLAGLLAAIPALPEALLTEQAKGVEDILDAVRLCHGAGARVVGLGAVTAVIGGQGKAVVETWARFVELRDRVEPVGLFGWPGAVAGGILRLLFERGATVRVVSASPPVPLLRTLERLGREGPGRAEVVASEHEVLGRGEVLIAASSTGGRIPLSALPAGAVVIDVAAPVDVDFDVPFREDVLVLDGEMVHLPGRLRGTEPWQTLYGWVTGQGQRIFACFAEPMLLAGSGRLDLAGCGRDLPIERLRSIAALARQEGFSVDALCARGHPVRASRLQAFAARRAR